MTKRPQHLISCYYNPTEVSLVCYSYQRQNRTVHQLLLRLLAFGLLSWKLKCVNLLIFRNALMPGDIVLLYTKCGECPTNVVQFLNWHIYMKISSKDCQMFYMVKSLLRNKEGGEEHCVIYYNLLPNLSKTVHQDVFVRFPLLFIMTTNENLLKESRWVSSSHGPGLFSNTRRQSKAELLPVEAPPKPSRFFCCVFHIFSFDICHEKNTDKYWKKQTHPKRNSCPSRRHQP